MLVLHPANGTLGMGTGRVFQHMKPTLRLDRVLEPADTEAWFDRLAPAVENDLMAGQAVTAADCGKATPVSSSETVHRRRAAAGSLAAGERPTRVGAPRISPRPSGPT